MEGGAHSKLSVQGYESVSQHHKERAPEVGAVSDGCPLLAGGGEGKQDTPQLEEYVAQVDVELLTANVKRLMPNTGTCMIISLL